jgi:hypothetical protein
MVDIAEYDFLYRVAFSESFEQWDSARTQAGRGGWISEDAIRKALRDSPFKLRA